MGLTGRHSGARIIVAGTAPGPRYFKFRPDDIVIGINLAPDFIECNYWLTCDPQHLNTRMPGIMDRLPLGCESFCYAFGGRPLPGVRPTYWFHRPPGSKDKNHQPIKPYSVPVKWTGQLQHVWTSATAGVNLAVIMGAKEIILYRVDLIGNTLSRGLMMPWASFASEVNDFLSAFRVPIYKTRISSPLSVPIHPETAGNIRQALKMTSKEIAHHGPYRATKITDQKAP